MGERGDVTCSKGPGFEPQLAAYVYVLNFAMPWPPHTSFVSHLGHPSKNVLDTPLTVAPCNFGKMACKSYSVVCLISDI
jgi:hypothetical protein